MKTKARSLGETVLIFFLMFLIKNASAQSTLNLPSTGIFQLFHRDGNEQIKFIFVKDVYDREVFFAKGNIGTVNLTGQPAGIYFLEVSTTDGGIYSVKLVKE